MREIRRKNRVISKAEAEAILENGEYGVLSTVGENGNPYGMPLNYCVIDSRIYFHCAIEGEKLDNIKFNNSVSFCVVGKTEVMPKKFGTKYESAIIFGDAKEVFDKEKQLALEGLLKKYSPNHFEDGLKYIEDLTHRTKIFKITINQITGKSRKQ